MADIYALPNSSVTDIVALTTWASDTSGGILFPGLILVIGFLSFLATKNFTAPIAFATSSFIVALLSIVATVAGWMNPTYMYFSFVLVAFSIVALRINGGRA